MAAKVALLAAAFAIASVQAICPNGCSGHGLCKERDQCMCDPNYFGADCSLRSCPYDYAFVDIPAGDLNHDGLVGGPDGLDEQYVSASQFDASSATAYELFPTDASKGGFAAAEGEAHFYMECSGKGACNRASGECVCSTGYTGAACQRSSCPNDCSGNGLCRTLREVAAGALSKRSLSSTGGNMQFTGVREPFDYGLWDADKHQMCVCDAGFDGIDCSVRTCPRSNDPLTPLTKRWCGGEECVSEIQSFRLSSASDTSYRLTFVSTRNTTLVAYATVNTATGASGFVPNPATDMADPTTNAGIIMNALRNIPGGLLQLVEVSAQSSDLSNLDSRTFYVTFVGLSGPQYLLNVEATNGDGTVVYGPDAPTAYRVVGNTQEIECAGRGLCDGSTGLCKCFSGYYGVACEYQNALAHGSASVHGSASAHGSASR